MQKRWIYKDRANKSVVGFMQRDVRNLDEVTAELLVQRGIDNFTKAKTFFRPTFEHLHDPFLMKDMGKAVEIIQQAMVEKRKILFYGDYDVDGTTSVALIFRFIQKHYDLLGYYVPDRHKEGYGVSLNGINWAKEAGFSLIITLDCGITAVDQVQYAKSLGIDVIVSDHHLPGESLPAAAAILNPKQDGCDYPFKELSGCGIGFKLCQALAARMDWPIDPLQDLLDLLAVSIASDIVPIVDENRVMAFLGLQKLNANPCPGLAAIRNLSMAKREDISISDIVFNIGPRINAAGRMGDARKAVDLLLAPTYSEAEHQAGFIETDNQERRSFDNSITQEALEQTKRQKDFEHRKTTVVYGETWHKGVIGIVASRLIEQYHRPTIVFSRADGKLTGSARTVNGFNIYDALLACSDYIEQFGGHKFAAGLTLKQESLDAFVEQFEQVVAASIREDQLIPRVDIDLPITFRQITQRFFRVLKQFAPFGPGNMQPVFSATGVYADPGHARIVGDNHLLINLRQEENGPYFQAIAFGMSEHHHYLSKGLGCDIAFTIEENIWKGTSTIKLNIKDISYKREQ